MPTSASWPAGAVAQARCSSTGLRRLRCWLDVGCGTGSFTELIVETCSPASVFAIDQERAQIDHARNWPMASRAHFRVGDAQA
ncbi:class I SAM-dependent methyltransferase [Bradyrhizobium australiense]|uniref:class I SAM-dependent methyltransferase n=1 Tax=Bradyrhizobium australiense TaxID=2721161 RepID=UPI001F28DE4D|nr:class I SAM-dependent methyltransferase [Bradyrhizobium australiense]